MSESLTNRYETIEHVTARAVSDEPISIATSKAMNLVETEAGLSRRALFASLVGRRSELQPVQSEPSIFTSLPEAPPVPADEMAQALPHEFDAEAAIDRLRPKKIAEATRRVLAKEVDRRTMLQHMVWVTAGVLYGTEAAVIHHETEHLNQAMDKLWPHNQPSFNFLEGPVPKNPKAIAIFFPGFGDMHSAQEAAMVKKDGQVKPSVSVGYLDYSNQGASIKEQADVIRQSIDLSHVQALTLVCRSMGGPFALGVAKELEVPIKNIIFCASPYEVSDGDYGEAGVALAKLPHNRPLSTVAKSAISFWRAATKNKATNPFRDFARSVADLFGTSTSHFNPVTGAVAAAEDFKKGLDDLGASLGHAVHETFSGANPDAASNELRTWDSEHLPTDVKQLTREDLEAYRKVFIPGYTNVLYTATDHPRTDQTVMVRRSAKHFQSFFVDMLGFSESDFQTKNIPYDGHANIQATMQHLRPWIEDNVKPPQPKQQVLADGASK